MNIDIQKIRNIGISAHIDSGKTTLTERMLFYCNKIHKIHEVKGKDGVGATMDSMELERERGITIASASTTLDWSDHAINVIDTPGHVDFTIEVERALRILDAAILVLCSVGGVQSQSITVDRQLRRYKVPSLAFINKCDRTGANPEKVNADLQDKLGRNSVLMQIPIGLEDKHIGVVDLVLMKALYFDGENGEDIRSEEIPPELVDKSNKLREKLIDAASLFSDELAEAYLDGNESIDQIYSAIRKGTISLDLTPVFIGSAYNNKGVQPLLDAVIKYLPQPNEVENYAVNLTTSEQTKLISDPTLPPIALAFKLEDGQYGQLTYIRIYQGTITKGDELYNIQAGKTFKVGRLIRMHADEMEDINSAKCGDIISLFGINCKSGDTFSKKGLNFSMTSMYVPKPVISIALNPKDKKSHDNLAKALSRFTREDPTFRSYTDHQSDELIISGMGELHLEVYIERIKREYNVNMETGTPQVSYRESITKAGKFNYIHKKQTGGAGQFGQIEGTIDPLREKDFEFVNKIKGGAIPTEFIPSCEKGFKLCMEKGHLIGAPIVGIRITIEDGNYHPVDSSSMAFQNAAIGAFNQVYLKSNPIILEPLMKVSVEGPSEFQGSIFSSINQRRGVIISTSDDNYFVRVDANVPLSEMFGYSTSLRSLTQGKAEFTMEFFQYGKAPESIAEKLIKEFNDSKK